MIQHYLKRQLGMSEILHRKLWIPHSFTLSSSAQGHRPSIVQVFMTQLYVMIPVERAFGLMESAPILHNAGEYNVITPRISKGRVKNGSALIILWVMLTAINLKFKQ